MASDGAIKREVFRIDNDEDRDLTILLEPWGQELSLAPGIGVDVVFEGAVGLSHNLALSRKEHVLVITVRQEGVAFFRLSAPDLVEELRQAS